MLILSLYVVVDHSAFCYFAYRVIEYLLPANSKCTCVVIDFWIAQ